MLVHEVERPVVVGRNRLVGFVSARHLMVRLVVCVSHHTHDLEEQIVGPFPFGVGRGSRLDLTDA